jgi:hypothetical protein
MRGEDRPGLLLRRMFWVGFVLRVLVITIGHTYRVRLILDHFQFGWEMGRIARSVVEGRGYADPFNGHSGATAWTPPLYPLLIAGAFKVFGVYSSLSAWALLTVNSVFSAATAPAVYELGWRCFGRDERGRKVALWSGWLWALYPAAMQYAVHWVWEMSLTAFLLAWALVLAVRLRGLGEASGADTGASQTHLRWLSFGVLWGLIALSNSSLLTFLPFCGVWAIWGVIRGRGPKGPVLARAALGAVCFLLVLTPWTYRNWRVFHAFVPMRTNFGAELYQSVLPSHHAFPWGAALPLAEQDPEFQRYEHLGELAYSKEQGRRGMAAIRSNPRRFVDFTALRTYFFWVGVPHTPDRPKAGAWLNEAGRELNYAFVSLASLLGLWLALSRRIPGAWLFFWAFAIVPFVYYFITVQARFRHPLEPLMTILIVYVFQAAEPARVRA